MMERTPSIALVLSGGGANGAYQVGVYCAMEQLGLLPYTKYLSGTSIGALNALVFCCTPSAQYCAEVWHSLRLPALLSPKRHSPFKREGHGFFSSRRFRDLITRRFNLTLLGQNTRHAYVCAYNLDDECIEFLCLNDLPLPEQLDAAVAAATLPVVFEPIHVCGHWYCDAGATHVRGRACLNVPVAPVLAHHPDVIIVVTLHPSDTFEVPADCSARIIHIAPSRPIEPARNLGILHFFRNSLAGKIKLGYADALELLRPLSGEICTQDPSHP